MRRRFGLSAAAERLLRRQIWKKALKLLLPDTRKRMQCFLMRSKTVVAYHEIGHALVAALQSHSAPVQKITIIPRTSGALGYTMQVEHG